MRNLIFITFCLIFVFILVIKLFYCLKMQDKLKFKIALNSLKKKITAFYKHMFLRLRLPRHSASDDTFFFYPEECRDNKVRLY